ncbi:outer membrane protein assembly factor BamB family protein [Streptomyces aureoverticillatus]|uniref:outer membrane protein assembly factor BamB family protein n=1 Tax=Streptomyces aureoverticillatus TaxID=66871 RepID=UPI0013DB6DD0|nr:PQQ-binding-like beta-propeller repeat protein [Streptomyces aureoverticillatus]QIB43201.1 PQQ-binding-like beta-propeller repeat protein [Streptomyces aureoverticillatus]
MSFGPPPSEFTESARVADSARKQRRTNVLAGLSSLLAFVLCAGGWMLWAGADDEKEQPKRPTAAPQAPDDIRETVEGTPRSVQGRRDVEYVEEDLKKDYGRTSVRAPGAWATDEVFVKAVGSTLKGFKLGNSTKEWSTDLGGPICDTTRHVTADGRTAVLFQGRERGAKGKGKSKREGSSTKNDPNVCGQLAFVDLNTGKKLWQVKLPAAKDAFAPNTNVTMTRGTVTVAWGRGSVAYDMDRGERLWRNTGAKTCQDTGFAGGRALLALVTCGDPSDPTYRVQSVDPRSGKPNWTYKVARGVKGVYLVSSQPAVLAVSAGDTVPTNLITLDDKGEYRSTIDLPEKRYFDRCFNPYDSVAKVETCDSIVVGRDQLFLASKDTMDGNWIVSFDLATGRTVRKFDPRDTGEIYPVRMSGDKLLAFRPGRLWADSAAVVSLDPRTGKETPLLIFSVPDITRLRDPERTDIIVESGRVYLAPRELSPKLSGEWKGIAYGALGVEPS